MTRPPYTPTDFVPIAGTIFAALLDAATLLGWIHLEPAQKTTLAVTFTSLLGVLIALFVGHRALKQVAMLKYVSTIPTRQP